MSARKLLGFVLTAVVFSAGASSAATLYGSEFGGSGFYNIDPADGSFTTLSYSASRANGLAYQTSTNSLVHMNIGSLTFLDFDDSTTTSIAISGYTNFLTGLAFNQTQSALYSIGLGGIYTIDVANGFASLLTSRSASACCGIAVDSSGSIFTVGTDARLWKYDAANSFAETDLGLISGLDAGMTAIAFDENDVLYGINTRPDSLVTVDFSTMSATLIGGDIGSDVRGLTFVPDVEPVPVPAAMPLFVGGLVLLGALSRRKSRRSS